MATADQVIGLLKSHVRGDDEQLFAIALQVAAAEARRGRDHRALELRGLVEEARSARSAARPELVRNNAAPTPLGTRHELDALATRTESRVRLRDMALSPTLHERLQHVLHEQRQRARLREHGQRPDARLLLVGPPGCGKTLTATALAGELRLPLLTIRLDGLITRYLGETAARMRRVFDEIHDRRAVYLFDEFDALGARRTETGDVGEMRRVLNSFLQFIEEPNSTDSLVVATTNRPESLDPALVRRFDEVIRYALPTPAEAEVLLLHHLGTLRPRSGVSSKALALSADLSQAEIAQAAREAAKRAILGQLPHVASRDLEAALAARQVMRREMDHHADGSDRQG